MLANLLNEYRSFNSVLHHTQCAWLFLTGLDGLHDLRELVLDKNKIKTITESSFLHQWNLQELHMEENRFAGL